MKREETKHTETGCTEVRRQEEKSFGRRPTLAKAKAKYVYRFTMEHVPQWACSQRREDGSYYAPQYRTDAEWYANTLFPGEVDCPCRSRHGYSMNQSWPLGKSLPSPFKVQS